MPSTQKTELQAGRVPAGRLADIKTSRQMDKQKKRGNKYIWRSDSDIMPASFLHTHARVYVCVCVCVLKGARQMAGLRKTQKYVWKGATPVETCLPFTYHLLFLLFFLFSPFSPASHFYMLHICSCISFNLFVCVCDAYAEHFCWNYCGCITCPLLPSGISRCVMQNVASVGVKMDLIVLLHHASATTMAPRAHDLADWLFMTHQHHPHVPEDTSQHHTVGQCLMNMKIYIYRNFQFLYLHSF